MDWFSRENLNRKPIGFYHQLGWGFGLKCSHHPVLWINPKKMTSPITAIHRPWDHCSCGWPWRLGWQIEPRKAAPVGLSDGGCRNFTVPYGKPPFFSMKKEVKPSNCMAMASSMLSMIPMFIMFQGEIRNFVGHPFLPLESQHTPTIELLSSFYFQMFTMTWCIWFTHVSKSHQSSAHKGRQDLLSVSYQPLSKLRMSLRLPGFHNIHAMIRWMLIWLIYAHDTHIYTYI